MHRTLTRAQWIDAFVLRLGELRKDVPLGELIEIATELWSDNRYLPPAEAVHAHFQSGEFVDGLSVFLGPSTHE